MKGEYKKLTIKSVILRLKMQISKFFLQIILNKIRFLKEKQENNEEDH